MILGEKIRTLRLAAKLTQAELAGKLEISSQAISKWENGSCAPDIYMLPKLSVIFGVTIDELFDITIENKLHRIENMLVIEDSISDESFNNTEKFLKEQLESNTDKGKVYALLGRLYHHRMRHDSYWVSFYAKKSLKDNPFQKDVAWFLQMSEGAAIPDWNIRQHSKTIRFYKDMTRKFPDVPEHYLELMENLLADQRTTEAHDILNKYKCIPGHQEKNVLIYEAKIALCEKKFEEADQWINELLTNYPDDEIALFKAAGYFAELCDYEKALKYYKKSYEKGTSPRYTDSLLAQAIIYEIQENYPEAISCYKKTLENLKEEWNTSEGAEVTRIRDEIERLKA